MKNISGIIDLVSNMDEIDFILTNEDRLFSIGILKDCLYADVCCYVFGMVT
jgi:hypothetical protein